MILNGIGIAKEERSGHTSIISGTDQSSPRGRLIPDLTIILT